MSRIQVGFEKRTAATYIILTSCRLQPELLAECDGKMQLKYA